MAARPVTVYFDYKSPFAFLAKEPAYDLEAGGGVRLTWLPYTLHISEYLGDAEGRTDHQWRKVKYAYMDARRLANKRGLTVRGPRKIFDSSVAHIGTLYALRQDKLRPYHDIVFERFFKRELEDIEEPGCVQRLLEEGGVDAAGFPDFLAGEGRAEHDRIRAEAEELGVFGVPTFVLDGELFWGGDRMELLRERLAGQQAG
jgi:2-hydroxychromene-2-carboxylate isomerase